MDRAVKKHRGLSLIFDLNWDRILILTVIFFALFVGSYIATAAAL